MTTFIKKKIEVDSAEASMSFSRGQFKKQPFSLENKNIFLLGLRGSGKTTLARALALALNCSWVDTDTLVEQNAGQSIAEIVAARGWDFFRTLEEQALLQAVALPGKVVATGGGSILAAANRALMGAQGVCFYLAADAALLTGRILSDNNPALRPPLTGLDLHDEIVQTMVEREPLYMATMDHLLQANRSIEDLVDDILVALGLKEWDFSQKTVLMDRY